jgi:hypothetical protein
VSGGWARCRVERVDPTSDADRCPVSCRIYQKEESFPTCPPDQCIIHVKATGICGS